MCRTFASIRASSAIRAPNRLRAVSTISFGTAAVVLDGSIANVALPTIARALAIDRSSAVLVVAVYQIVLVMSLLPFASLADRLGHLRFYRYGQSIFVVASLACLWIDSLPLLLLVRAIQALGAAATLSVSTALLRSIYPPDWLGRGLSLNSLIVACAAALAPTVGGIILGFAAWQNVFIVAVPLSLASLLLGTSLPAGTRHASHFNVKEAVLCAATFGLVMGGIELATSGAPLWLSVLVILAGLGLGIAFVRRELRETRPIMPVDLLRLPVLRLSVLGALLAFIAWMTILVSIPFRLEHHYGFRPAEVGTVLAVWPLAMMLIAPIAGSLSDRTPQGLLGIVGMVIVTGALIAIALLPEHPSYFDLAWRMGLCGGGFGLFLSPNSRQIMGAAPPERAASAGGLIGTTRLTGQSLGATIAGGFMAVSGGAALAAIAAAVLTTLAGLCSLALFHPRLREPARHAIDPLVDDY
ncbi:MAG: transporter [Alphaproteobacteria bacterium]|nr:transporter [Alphaproteobacteria bacterium]